MTPPKTFYPCLLMYLEPGDDGYDKGSRFMVESEDREHYFFRTQAAAYDFMHKHGFQMVTADAMKEMRRPPSPPDFA